MTDREVLEGYRHIGAEMRLLQKHIELLCELSGVQDRRAGGLGLADGAAERLREVERCRAELDRKWKRLCGLQARFEGIMARITDPQERLVMRAYYGLGLSDEKAAESMCLSRTSVINRRHVCVRRLEAAEETRRRRERNA